MKKRVPERTHLAKHAKKHVSKRREPKPVQHKKRTSHIAESIKHEHSKKYSKKRAAKRENIIPHTVFLVHGTEGNPDEAWYAWLKHELHRMGCRVIAPQFPTPEGQNLINWLDVIDKYRDQIDENTIFVGRSMGVPFILRILERQKAKAAFLVAGFCSYNGEYKRELITPFLEDPFDWPTIKSNCSHFHAYYSDNDPYLSEKELKEVPENLGIRGTLVKGAGHFNVKSGYDRFSLILRDLKKVMKK